MVNFLKKFEENKVFTEDEAWFLFRIAAIAEAVGWTLLIAGIGLTRFVVHNQIPVQLAGRFHGMLFLLYMLAAVGLYPALRWPRWKAFIALLASVPPYGSLIFELWASSRRKRQSVKAVD